MIKKIILLVFISIFAFGMNYNLKPIQISNNVWQFLGANDYITKQNGGNIANTYWIRTAKHWVVIDSGPTYEYAKQAHQVMKKISDLPIHMVINTHKHDDHWMGNNYYKLQGIKIIATKLQDEEDDDLQANRMLNILNKKDLKNTKVVAIDEYITGNKIITVDNTKLEFQLLEVQAHTKEDMLIYMPSENVLFSGDLLFSERITSIRDGSVEGSLKSLNTIEKINPTVYANGHGKYTDNTALKDMKEYLTALKTLALEAVDEDVGFDHFSKNTEIEAFKNYKMYDILNGDNLAYAYREYEFFEEE